MNIDIDKLKQIYEKKSGAEYESITDDLWKAVIKEAEGFKNHIEKKPEQLTNDYQKLTEFVEQDTQDYLNFGMYKKIIHDINNNFSNELLKNDSKNRFLSYVSSLVNSTNNQEFKDWWADFRLPFTKEFYNESK